MRQDSKAINIGICDDEKIWLDTECELIEEYLNKKHVQYNISTFNNAVDMLDSGDRFDIVFTDIQMNDINGIELARNIHYLNKNCIIFFVTNYELYMDKAMNEHAFRFWTKPIEKERLAYGLDSAIKELNKENDYIIINDRKQSQRILIRDIIGIIAQDKKTRIVTTKNDFVVNEPFKQIKSKIKVDYFCESHASFYINFNFVMSYSTSEVICKSGDIEYHWHMSRRKYREFDKRFFEWAGELHI